MANSKERHRSSRRGSSGSSEEVQEYEAEQNRKIQQQMQVNYQTCQEHRQVLEKKFGGDIQTKLLQADNFEKIRFLQDIFKEFDVDDSGEMDMHEFLLALRTCGFRVSSAAALSIMKEVDVDESGSIDMDEFIEFFKKMDDLEAFRYKVEKVQYASGMRKQVISGYILVLLAACFALLVMDIRSGGKDTTVRLVFIVFVVLFFISISSVLLLPLFAMKFKPEERFAALKDNIKWSQPKKNSENGHGKVTLVEAVDIPAPPPHGAVANAQTAEQFSYRKHGKSEASKLSHRSEARSDVGLEEIQEFNAANQPGSNVLHDKAWESPDAPHVEKDLALLPVDQNEMPPVAVVQAPSRHKAFQDTSRTDTPQYGFSNARYDVSQYQQARQMAARQADNTVRTDQSFSPWSQSRHRPLASAYRH